MRFHPFSLHYRALSRFQVVAKENIQSSFLEKVRSKLPPTISFVDELAELLDISRDSAYRRIRGETILSLDEVKKMCDHFKISLDHALSPSSEIVTFQIRALDATNFSFEKWLQSILDKLKMFGGFQGKELIYNAKDLPPFHFFQYPQLSAFKMYFWKKAFSGDSKFSSGKYHPGLIGKELIAIGQKIWEEYAAIPSTEILSVETLNIMLRNIEFAHECGMFENPDEGNQLCDACLTLTDTMRRQAEMGKKGADASDQKGGRYELYHNEILLGDNTILFKMGDKRVTNIIANNFDILTTNQESFCKLTESFLNNLISKSTLISHNAQKERIKFFNILEEKIRETKEKIS